MEASRARRLILTAAIVGLLARLAFGFLYWTDKPLTHDEREYLALAESLGKGRGLRYPPGHDTGTAQQFGRAPGYPVFLAAIGAEAVTSSTPARVKVAQAALGALAVWMIGVFALTAAGARAGAIAGAIAAVYPPLVWIGSYVLSEALFIPLALGCALLVGGARARAEGARSARAGGALAVAAGLVAGLAILVRPGMLFYLPIVAAWFVLRRRWTLALAFCISAAVVVAPWTLRNLREYDRFVLVATEGGVTFWTGNHPLAIGEGDLAANPAIKADEVAFRQSHAGLSPGELEPLYYRAAFAQILANPGWWLMLLGKKLFYTFVPIGPSYTLHSTRYLLASVIPYALLVPPAFIGLFRLARRDSPATPLLLLALSVVVTALVFFPQERFRIPVIDPTAIVCASAVLAGARRQS